MSFSLADLYQLGWVFLFYAFAGWVIEVIFHATQLGLIVNRGFLCGPVCPVYGVAGVAVHFLIVYLLPLSATANRVVQSERGESLLVLYVAGCILATIVELVAGWMMYHLFHTRWWDYSDEPLNFHGYICLRFSLLWGIAVVIVVRIITPLLTAQHAIMEPGTLGWILWIGFFALFGTDIVVSSLIASGMHKQLHELDDMKKQLSLGSDYLTKEIGQRALDGQNRREYAKVQRALAGYELRDAVEEGAAELYHTLAQQKADLEIAAEKQRQEQAAAWEQLQKELENAIAERKIALSKGTVFGPRRLLKAFPGLQADVSDETLKEVTEEVNTVRKKEAS